MNYKKTFDIFKNCDILFLSQYKSNPLCNTSSQGTLTLKALTSPF